MPTALGSSSYLRPRASRPPASAATGLSPATRLSSGAGRVDHHGRRNAHLQTKNPAAAAVGLQGNGASIFATGGGTIASAGNAIEFLGGKNQVATFDNFTIANTTGNLIFADPSASTVNFNNTTANAGIDDLLDATSGSSDHAQRERVRVDRRESDGLRLERATSISPMDPHGPRPSTITVSQRDTDRPDLVQHDHSDERIDLDHDQVVRPCSNLAVTNSAIVFAPPGSGAAFKTLTVGSYSGTGANLTMNTVLGGTGSKTDELVINGGTAPGTTLVTINNATVNG